MPSIMKWSRHSSWMLWMSLSTWAFRFGEQCESRAAEIPDFRKAMSKAPSPARNFPSRSRSSSRGLAISVGTERTNPRTALASHAASGFVVDPETCARLVLGWTNTRLNAYRRPRGVKTRVIMKSQAQSVLACALRNCAQLFSPREGPVGIPASFKMFTTVDRDTLEIPSFLSSTRMRT